MFQCGRALGVHRILDLLAATLLLLPTGARAQELRTVLATGDDVPGLGRIGELGINLIGLDDQGRALISSRGGEGEEIVWADGTGFAPLIDSGATGVSLFGSTLIQRAGSVAGFGVPRGAPDAYGEALYSIVGGALRELARVGDRDADGYTICRFETYTVNRSGAVAFTAEIAPAGFACDDGESEESATREGLYLADSGLHRLSSSGPLAPDGGRLYPLVLVGLTDGGEAVVHSRNPAAPSVLAVGGGGARVLYRLGGSDGAGEIAAGNDIQFLTTSPDGELIFRRLDGEVASLYRTAAGTVRRLVAADQPAPWTGSYSTYDAYPWTVVFAPRGDVLLIFDRGRAVLYPADGTPQLFPGYALSGVLNDRGDVALVRRPLDQYAEVVRFRDGDVQRLAATGDRLADGGVLAAYGLGAACLAPNGAIAVVAQATNGANALLCGDGHGFAPVTRRGDPRPDGRRFYGVEACAFAGADELLFLGTGLAPSGRERTYIRKPAVYRARPDRLERVLGPGDAIADGTTITALPSQWSSVFDADPSGRVLVMAATSTRAALLTADGSGAIERVPLPLRNNTYPNEEIWFDPSSSVDHQYLAGITQEPGVPAAAARATAAGSATSSTAATADPYYEVGAVWASYASLAASGGVFVLGAEAVPDPDYVVVDRSVVLYVAPDGTVAHIAVAGESSPLPGAPFSRFDGLSVHGDRIAFMGYGDRTEILTWALGDAAPSVLVGTGDASPAGPLLSPFPLGVTAGGVYFLDYPQGAVERFLFSRSAAAFTLAAPIGNTSIWWSGVSDAGALLAAGDSALHVVGDAPAGASCPHPPNAVFSLPPTPTPRPGTTPPPGGLPFEPSTCLPDTVCIQVDPVTGSPGATVQVGVWLATAGEPVAGVQNDLLFPPEARISRCARNEDIDKSGTDFSITHDRTRAIVLSLTDVDPIPDASLLYTCNVDIAADAAPGYYRLTCANSGASGPEGNYLPSSCADGVLTVEAPRHGDAAQLASAQSGGGCAVQPGARSSAWWLPVALLALIRRRHRTVS